MGFDLARPELVAIWTKNRSQQRVIFGTKYAERLALEPRETCLHSLARNAAAHCELAFIPVIRLSCFLRDANSLQ
jgi:hypothetical protein